MNMTLTRFNITKDGVFGKLQYGPDFGDFFFTLEHAYAGEVPNSVQITSKLKPGVYTCILGQHKLHDGVPFSTYEIKGVEGHAGILFHVGNYNGDSQGCVLLGQAYDKDKILNSKSAFAQFLKVTDGAPSFTLEVINA